MGEEITLSILRGQDAKDIKVTLAAQPKQANVTKRFFAEDLGFVVREMVFNDTYARKLPVDQKGVLVALERPVQGLPLKSRVASQRRHRHPAEQRTGDRHRRIREALQTIPQG